MVAGRPVPLVISVRKLVGCKKQLKRLSILQNFNFFRDRASVVVEEAITNNNTANLVVVAEENFMVVVVLVQRPIEVMNLTEGLCVSYL